MARIARIVAPGLPHHVTQRGNRRQATFFTEDDYNHWEKKRTFLINNEKDFTAEKFGDLHRRRLSEAEVLDDLAKKGKMRRYLYMIKKIGT